MVTYTYSGRSRLGTVEHALNLNPLIDLTVTMTRNHPLDGSSLACKLRCIYTSLL